MPTDGRLPPEVLRKVRDLGFLPEGTKTTLAKDSIVLSSVSLPNKKHFFLFKCNLQSECFQCCHTNAAYASLYDICLRSTFRQ